LYDAGQVWKGYLLVLWSKRCCGSVLYFICGGMQESTLSEIYSCGTLHEKLIFTFTKWLFWNHLSFFARKSSKTWWTPVFPEFSSVTRAVFL